MFTAQRKTSFTHAFVCFPWGPMVARLQSTPYRAQFPPQHRSPQLGCPSFLAASSGRDVRWPGNYYSNVSYFDLFVLGHSGRIPSSLVSQFLCDKEVYLLGSPADCFRPHSRSRAIHYTRRCRVSFNEGGNSEK